MLLLGLASCRFGFDSVALVTSDDGGSTDTIDMIIRGDGELPPTCVATQVAVTLNAPVGDVVASTVPGGYALGFIENPSSYLGGVALDPSLVPNAATLFRTSPTEGSLFTYSRASLFWTGSLLVGSTSVVEDGNCYHKVWAPDMSAFIYADGGQQCRTGEQSIANLGGSIYSTWFEGSEHLYVGLKADGTEEAPDLSAGFAPNTIVNTSVASGEAGVIAAEMNDGTCEVRQFPTVVAQSLSTTCTDVHLVSFGQSTKWLAVYEAGTSIELRELTLTAIGTNLTISNPGTLATGQSPRLFKSGSVWLVAYNKGSSLGVTGIDPVAALPISGLPSGAPDAFDVAGPYIFAAYGADLYAVTCP